MRENRNDLYKCTITSIKEGITQEWETYGTAKI